jgi:hypothetical protein
VERVPAQSVDSDRTPAQLSARAGITGKINPIEMAQLIN